VFHLKIFVVSRPNGIKQTKAAATLLPRRLHARRLKPVQPR
jgi:hypothetical protein